MKKFIMMIALLTSLNVQAGLINLTTSDTEVGVGDSIELTVSGSNFDPFDTLSLDIEFDTSLFSFDSMSVGGDLFNIPPILFQVTEQSFGIAIAFLDFFDFSGGDFTLVSLNLNALEVASADITLTNAVVDSFTFGSQTALGFGINEVSIEINTSDIPSPSVTALMMLFTMLLIRFKSNR